MNASSEQTPIISLYNNNLLVFITEIGYVSCSVETDLLQIMQIKLDVQKVTLVLLKISSHSGRWCFRVEYRRLRQCDWQIVGNPNDGALTVNAILAYNYERMITFC
jgi:hypothetical protein